VQKISYMHVVQEAAVCVFFLKGERARVMHLLCLRCERAGDLMGFS
jgi:hypothetical protein